MAFWWTNHPRLVFTGSEMIKQIGIRRAVVALPEVPAWRVGDDVAKWTSQFLFLSLSRSPIRHIVTVEYGNILIDVLESRNNQKPKNVLDHNIQQP